LLYNEAHSGVEEGVLVGFDEAKGLVECVCAHKIAGLILEDLVAGHVGGVEDIPYRA